LSFTFFPPLKETAAGEGVTLFGLLMTSDLAVFQQILHHFLDKNAIAQKKAKTNMTQGAIHRIHIKNAMMTK